MRAGFPRHAPVLTANVRGLWAADVSRFVSGIAGDRPPRYGEKNVPFTVGRGPVPRRAPVVTATVRGLWAAGVFRRDREIAGDRPPRYGNN